MRIKLLILATVAHRQTTKIVSDARSQGMPLISCTCCLPPERQWKSVISQMQQKMLSCDRFGLFIPNKLKIGSVITLLPQMNIEICNIWHVRQDCDCEILERKLLSCVLFPILLQSGYTIGGPWLFPKIAVLNYKIITIPLKFLVFLSSYKLCINFL